MTCAKNRPTCTPYGYTSETSIEGPKDASFSYGALKRLVADGVEIRRGTVVENGSENGAETLRIVLRRGHRNDHDAATIAN